MTAKEELKIAYLKLEIIRSLKNYKEEYKNRLDNVSSNQEYDTIKDAIDKFEEGVDIGDDKPTLPAELIILPVLGDEAGKKTYSAELTIHEGRLHQVKRMFETVGCTVIYLKRLSMGSLTLGDLSKGEYRKLTNNEISKL